MSKKSTRQNPANEVDELRQMIEVQPAEARRRNEEALRRDQRIEQQGEMLRQLLTRLNNQQQQPQPQQLQQQTKVVGPAEVNVPVPPMLRPNVQLPRMASLIKEPIYERFKKQKPPML